ncbi:fucolectin-1-like [Physella acuta]|uniref:fucolectin-1-like n=1 Tax=Physella acuta TaxID=109671 RepID=UPI0027DC758A|nr:fucolectin-1-like [Physella acuta]
MILSWLLMQYLLSASGADTFYNVALYKPAFQSTLYKDWTSDKGNDGGTRVAEKGGQCVQTWPFNNSWWMVDLLDSYVIKSVVLDNRNDYLGASTRLRNFKIDVFNDDPRLVSTFPTVSGDICYNQTEPATNGTFTWNCRRPLIGRYVRIIMLPAEILNFCELQVMSPLPTETSEFKVYKKQMLNTTAMSKVAVSSCAVF